MTFRAKMIAYIELGKFSLATLVVLTALLTYLIGNNNDISWATISALAMGGFAVTAASNALNQLFEIKYDALMQRTQKRPLPTSRLTSREALFFAIILSLVGVALLGWKVNMLTAALSVVALILYAFLYTPLKRVSPIAVWVGALPGAMPILIGYVAATGRLDAQALMLFGVQFFWQFPHFWAIAWVAHDDYTKAGYKLLPGPEGKDLMSALHIVLYAFFLIPASLMPFFWGFVGGGYAITATLCGILFWAQTLYLLFTHTKANSLAAARYLMFGSFLYLPVVLIAYYLDKLN